MKTNINDYIGKIIQGDCLDVMKTFDDDCIDTLITDPPAGISFMSAAWDSDKGSRDEWIKWLTEIMQECYRVLKPGATALVWAIPRTSHWTATAIEDAGFQIKDVVVHLFGSGFPKSHNIGKATKLDEWQGYGTALKPAAEHWIMAKKPNDGTYANNALVHGVSGLNIDQARITNENESLGEKDPLLLILDSVSFSTPDACADFLKCIFSVLKPCSNSDKDLSRNEVVLDGKKLVDEQYDTLAKVLPPNGAWYDLKQNVALNFQCDCQLCLRSYDVFVQNVEVCDQDGVQKLADVLVRISQFQLKPLHIHELLDNDHLSTEDVFLLIQAYCKKLKDELYTSIVSLVQTSSKGRFPSNVILDEEAAELLDEQSGERIGSASSSLGTGCGQKKGFASFLSKVNTKYTDKGGASRFMKNIMVDEDDFFMCNMSICGLTLENQKVAIILNGVKKEVEKYTQDVELFLCGKKKTENFQKDIVSIIKTVIKLMTDLKTSSVLPGKSISTSMEGGEKIIKLLKELNVENARDVKTINSLIVFKNELQELIRDIVKIVLERNSRSGEKQTGKSTMNTTENTASRIKYTAKASKAERNAGCEGLEEKMGPETQNAEFRDKSGCRGATKRANHHPTVKPLKLMQYLCRLTKTPTGGIVLDPFVGSGSTLIAAKMEGREYIGIEMEQEYIEIAKARLKAAQAKLI